MANTIAQKLRIHDGMKLLTIHAPADFEEHLAPLPAGVRLSEKKEDYQQIHWFVKNKAAMEGEMDEVIYLLKAEVICWIYYPKISSKIQTDLTRDKGWDGLLAHTELKWISLISFDDTWSAFGMRLKTAADETKTVAAKPRLIFDYIDATTRTIRLPDELEQALRTDEQASTYFNTLSFTNKKEYVEWIVTARLEETKKERVAGTMERLAKGWKNPRNL